MHSPASCRARRRRLSPARSARRHCSGSRPPYWLPSARAFARRTRSAARRFSAQPVHSLRPGSGGSLPHLVHEPLAMRAAWRWRRRRSRAFFSGCLSGMTGYPGQRAWRAARKPAADAPPVLDARGLQVQRCAHDDLVALGPQLLDRSHACNVAPPPAAARRSRFLGLDGMDLAVGVRAVCLDHVAVPFQAPPEYVHQVGLRVAMEHPADPHRCRSPLGGGCRRRGHALQQRRPRRPGPGRPPAHGGVRRGRHERRLLVAVRTRVSVIVRKTR